MFFSLILGCGDEVKDNSSPIISILSPQNEDSYSEGEMIALSVEYSDPESNAEVLELIWLINEQVVCDEVVSNAAGDGACSFLPSIGTQSVRVEVYDPEGKSSGATLTLFVNEGSAPTAEILSPNIGTRYYTDIPIPLSGTVADAEDLVSDLQVTWMSSITGELIIAAPDQDGQISDEILLPEGSHLLSLEVIDGSSRTAQATADIIVMGINEEPNCSLGVSPDESSAGLGEELTLTLAYSDFEQSSSELLLSLQSDQGYDFGTITANTDGLSEWVGAELSTGQHGLTFSVTDELGAVCIDTRSIQIGTPPAVSFASQHDGEVFLYGAPVTLEITVSDSEQAPEELSVIWSSSIDGELSQDQADSSGTAQVTFPTLSPGQHVMSVEVVDRDGLIGSDSISTIINRPPYITNFELTPFTATTTDELNVSYLIVDDDGDTIQSTVQWFQNGVLSTASTADTLTQTATQKGETWMVEIIPSDSLHIGETASTSVTIQNTPPEIVSVQLTPTTPSRSDTLNCILGSSNDADGDALSFQFLWWVNGVPLAEVSESLSVPNFGKGDSVYCSVTPDDNEDMGLPVSSNTVDIINAIPSLTDLSILPEGASSVDVISCGYQFSDLDVDADGTTVEWMVNGTPAGIGEVLMATVIQGDTVTCSVQPYDGEDFGLSQSTTVVVENAPPTIEAVTVLPISPTAIDTLSCGYSGFYDADGDPDYSLIQWEINGSIVASGTSLSSGFVGGDIVGCLVTPSDGLVDGQVVSEVIAIANTAPTVSNVTVIPSSPVAGEPLSCSYSFVDVDGDVDVSQIQWYQNDILASTEPIFQGIRDDEIRCEVIANDGEFVGNTASASIVIANAPPQILSLSIAPESPKALDILSVIIEAEDSDGDTPSYSYEWYVGSVLQATTPELNGLNNFVRGELVYVQVTPDDGYVSGVTAVSSTIVIVNSTPEGAVFEINPNQNIRVIDDLICQETVPAVDIDGDSLTYIFNWYVDDVLFTDTTTSFYSGDTVLSLDTNKRETWRCEVTIDDGSGETLSVEAFAEVTADYSQRVGTGLSHTCYIDSDGYASCWGISSAQVNSVPPNVFNELVTAGDHNCGLTEAGEILCWGTNSHGQAAELSVASSGYYTQVATSRFHTCALTDAAELECWGECLNGECLSDPGPWAHIGASNHLTCAVNYQGELSCWGVETTYLDDNYVIASSGNNNFDTYGCAVAEGAIVCWGSDFNNNVTHAPFGDFDFLSLGGAHSCAINFDGVASCWGNCVLGQCGSCIGTECELEGGPYVSIAAGNSHTCAVDGAGVAFCIGQDSYGKVSGAPGNSNP